MRLIFSCYSLSFPGGHTPLEHRGGGRVGRMAWHRRGRERERGKMGVRESKRRRQGNILCNWFREREDHNGFPRDNNPWHPQSLCYVYFNLVLFAPCGWCCLCCILDEGKLNVSLECTHRIDGDSTFTFEWVVVCISSPFLNDDLYGSMNLE